MKFLVLGATGMAGHLIAIYLQEQGHDIITFSTTPFNYCNNIVGDALNTNLLRRTILDNEYDIVINCIGILNQAANEHKANAVFLNSYLPHYICQITRDTPTRLIHMSTDCVFSGKKGNYREDSFRDGESFYDISKALGEIDDHKNLTFRNSRHWTFQLVHEAKRYHQRIYRCSLDRRYHAHLGQSHGKSLSGKPLRLI